MLFERAGSAFIDIKMLNTYKEILRTIELNFMPLL